MHNNTKYWAFTWDTNVKQKQLPNEVKLKKFLNKISDYYTFQLECGKVKSKNHWQGALVLSGTRVSKKQLLDLFKQTFRNVDGLTLSKIYDKKAAMEYASKSDTRVKGPFYVGRKEKFDEGYANLILRPWQNQVFEFILKNKNSPIIRERKILWIEDSSGCTGKSKFQKWLRLGQREVIARKLPVSTVERLISAVTKLVRQEDIDVLMINLTKTRGQDQSLADLLAAIEDIKDGFIVDTLYGKYIESIFEPPIVLVFSNEKLDEHISKLSFDRWLRLHINSDLSIEYRKQNEDGTVSPISLEKL